MLFSWSVFYNLLLPYFVPTASPPKTLTLDEVMESARDLSNLSLAHEIIVNRNFHLEPQSLPQDRYTTTEPKLAPVYFSFNISTCC